MEHNTRKIPIPAFFTLLVLVGLVLTTGCRSPEKAAYNTIGTVVYAVDTGMTAYADEVVRGRISPENIRKIEIAHGIYRSSMALVQNAITGYRISQDRDALDVALEQLANASGTLTSLINQVLAQE